MAEYYDLYRKIVDKQCKDSLNKLVDYGEIGKTNSWGCQWAAEAISQQKSLFNDFCNFIKNSPKRTTYVKQVLDDENTKEHYFSREEYEYFQTLRFSN